MKLLLIMIGSVNMNKLSLLITIAGKDRRNLLRNSNFYKATTDYWEAVNNPILEIESLNAKK